MLFYKILLLVVVNLGLYFLAKKNFPQLNKQVFGLIIAIGLATGSVLDYLLFKNMDCWINLWPALIFLGVVTFLLAHYIFKR